MCIRDSKQGFAAAGRSRSGQGFCILPSAASAPHTSTTIFDFKRGELSFFGRARPEFFFTERASPRAFLFFCGGGELKFFSGKIIPKSTKIFRPAAPERGRSPSFDLKRRRRLALGGLKLF